MLLGLLVLYGRPGILGWPIMLLVLYVMGTLFAAVTYAISKTPEGGLPPSNGTLLLSIAVLLLPREALR